jgi:hypothetical protein
MFGFSNRERAERELKEIQQWVFGQSVAHGAHFPPAGVFESRLQMDVALEFCAFYLHVVNRFSYRQSDERLREQIYDPSVRQMVRTFSDMICARWKPADLHLAEQETLEFFNARELEYSRAKQLLSKVFNDLESVTWLAAHNIARAAEIPERDIRILAINTELVESLILMDLANRIKRIASHVAA